MTIEDQEDGTINVQGAVEGVQDDSLPSGAQIMFAYMQTHMDEITVSAQEWFRNELIVRVSADKTLEAE